MTVPGLPEIDSLTAETFAALPRKKISSLCTKADGRSGDALRARLAPLTNCASYLVCIGSLGMAARAHPAPGDLAMLKATLGARSATLGARRICVVITARAVALSQRPWGARAPELRPHIVPKLSARP